MKPTTLCSVLGLALSAAALSPLKAAACGGFFCNASQPVNQQAERIIFAREPDGSVTAVIQIQYQGPSEKFAWMLPVEGDPEIGVSSDAAFTRLQNATNPSYVLNTRTEGTCRDEREGLFGGGFAANDSAGSSAFRGKEEGGGVTVLSQGSVGPYDHITIALDPNEPDLANVAIDWLQENGYDVPDMGADVLRPYLEAGMNLLAFRLTKGSNAGTIRPVRLTFGEGLPAIPLRPTAVAAEPDMGILVWVLGEHRAVPANYRSLELNDALIDWFTPGLTYDAVVTLAANEAKGQGFVTEHAGDARVLGEQLWQSWEAEQWSKLRAASWQGRERELLDNLSFLGQLDGIDDVLEKHLDLPTPVGESFLNCPSCYDVDVSTLDADALLADVQREVIDPMVETKELFMNTKTSTRLYTTMSADEMTVDPLFDFNPDLPAFSNLHQADRIIECSRRVDRADAPWRVELESGEVVRGKGNNWPFTPGDEGLPANAIVRRVGNQGEGEVVTDNVSKIRQALSAHNKTIPGPGGCALSNADQSSNLTVWAGLGLLLALRRRRR